jgi:hypothetical protein
MTVLNDLAERRAVEKVVQTYLDGLYEGDADKLALAFHPTSALTSIGADGALTILPRDKWFEWVRARPSPAKTGLARHDHIISIEIAGPTMALAKVNCAIPPRYFTDQLNLLKIEGRWQIAQKLFMTETVS